MSRIYHQGLKTDDTDLALALVSVGISPDWRKPCEEFHCPNRGPYVVFYFEPSSKDGKMVTDELIAAWSDDEWHERYPEHPFAYLKVNSMNKKRLLDLVKSREPIAVIRKGDKNAFLSLNASKRVADAVLGEMRI